MNFKLLVSIFVFSISSQAATIKISTVKQRAVGNFAMGAGSTVKLTLADGTETAGMFLGGLVHPNGDSPRYLFLDLKKTRVYLVPKSEVTWRMKGAPQPILSPYEQVGGTCASYAMFDYFLQLKMSQTIQSEAAQSLIDEKLSTEEGRTQLLASSINEYYLERTNRATVAGAMNKIAKNYGMKCKAKTFKTNIEAIAYLKENLDQGIPVTIEFYLGSDMVTSTYEVQDFESLSPQDPRLWVPRKRGQRDGGGHTIVLAASFYNSSRFKAVAVDSDWTEPRIWDVANYLSKRTVMDDIAFTTCK